MAYEGPQIKLPGLTANADLSAKQFYYVKLAGAGLVDVCSAVTDIPIGVLQNTPASGMPAEVCALGETKIVTAAATAAGAEIGTSANGRAAAYVPGTDTTKRITGQMVTATGAANGIGTAVVNCINPARGA